MNKSTIIIADASPLIAFGRIDSINLLTETFGNIVIPDVVARECLNEVSKPGAQAIQHAIHTDMISIHTSIPISHDIRPLLSVLDEGEASAITLALHLQCGILIDEKLGRKAAHALHVPIIGTAGALLLAKQHQKINAVKPILQQLKKAGYFLSRALVAHVLDLAGEK